MLILEISSFRVKVQILSLLIFKIMMLLYPKKTKFKVLFSRKKIKNSNKFIFKSSLKTFALISLETAKINNKQIESLHKKLKRLMKSHGKFWINLFPNMPSTKKPEGTRMGKGKGNLKFWYFTTPKGFVLGEMNGCSWNQIKRITQSIKNNLSIKIFLSINHS